MLVYGMAALAVAAFLATGLLPSGVLPNIHAQAVEANRGGLGAIVEASLAALGRRSARARDYVARL